MRRYRHLGEAIRRIAIVMRPSDLGEKPIIGFPLRSAAGVTDVFVFSIAIGRFERREFLVFFKNAGTRNESVVVRIDSSIARESAIEIITYCAVSIVATWDNITSC